MNKKIMSIIMSSLLAVLTLTGCGNEDEDKITYNDTAETSNAETMFAANDLDGLTDLCKNMAQKNDNPQSRDNFFAYFLDKVMQIDENNEENLYATTISLIDECLKYPLTSAEVVNGLQKSYSSIDTKMIEKVKEYMLGEWRRIDDTSLSGTVITVENDPEFGFISRVTSLPDDPDIKFEIGDIKWSNVEFANYKMFFLSDMTTTEITGQKNYYKNDDATISSLRGATALINFDNDTITVTYDRAASVTSGSRQVWIKVGSDGDNQNTYKTYLNEAENDEKETHEEPDTQSSGAMGMTKSDSQLKDNQLSNGSLSSN